ncbi:MULTISPECIES: heat-inducible transcriptional repressor HrcA [Limibacillus]|jgi:heat-inducible transcriptional repressor|uniref:Heat-inducible transcription repressor HrcA n=1 Tax=Limibacillus halophilus TaxID=1579333 RepID=A0A839SSK6_9PROT|nr:heat-inducible transcriptional repressor HrcA [Limibacillus halophilus]MBB3063893.1 heat-inducible transcriptional repressor [Limibacillus halophilus]
MAQPLSFKGLKRPLLDDLNERSREIFRHIVEAYVETGAPIGSRTLSRRLGLDLSPATIRNVMADLEELGLLFAPHTSAGRLPTDLGLSMFVHGLLEHGNIGIEERQRIEAQCHAQGRSYSEALEEAGATLSQLSRCAGLVVAPKVDEALKHIEFVSLGPGRALVVMVTNSGKVENRVIDVPIGLPPSSLVQASNFLTARLVGRTLGEAQKTVKQELEEQQAQLDEITTRLVEAGLATWSPNARGGALIVRGQAQLLDEITAIEDLERVRQLFAALEARETLLKLLDLTEMAEGVQIFIGAENELFGVAGCSMVVAPYQNSQQQIVGAIGVIGPSRMDYGRIIPLVDYTAKVIGRLIG